MTSTKRLAAALGLVLVMAGCESTELLMPVDEQIFSIGGDFAASHILFRYRGAPQAPVGTTRNRDEALAEAERVAALLQEDPGQFVELARTISDGPTRDSDGSLGSWTKGQFSPAFEEVLEAMEDGEISDPVETEWGFHVIRKDPLLVPHFAGHGFVISWLGNPYMTRPAQRSYEEGLELAEKVAAELTRDNFDEYATRYNDFGYEVYDPGVLRAGPAVPPDLLAELSTTPIGEIAGPMELPVGFVFIKRRSVIQLAGAHILVKYDGAEGSKGDVSRTKEEALARAETIAAQVGQDFATFRRIASEASDDIQSRPNGGRLGNWFVGSMTSNFDKAMADLDVGEISSTPVETPFGYHILARSEPE